jgi:hypothetical protein
MLCIPGSLELVLWYCNNFYSNSVLFKVRNVVTSLLGLVIVSHLSLKGSGRFNLAYKNITITGLSKKSRISFPNLESIRNEKISKAFISCS